MVSAINNYAILDVIQPPEEIRKGVIVLPGIVNVTPRWAKVVSVGDGIIDGHGTARKPDVDIGQTVYVTAHGQYGIHKNASMEIDNIAAASILDILAILEDLETMKIQPLGSYVEIEKIEIDEKSEHGIELPDSRKTPTNLGIVKTVGIGWTGPYGTPIPMQVNVGDKVVYNPLRTMIVDFSSIGKDEKKYLIQHGDILGVVK